MNPADADHLTQLFGTRELALAGSGAGSRAGMRTGIAVGAVDVATLMAARGAGKVNAASFATPPTLGAAAVGLGYLGSRE